MNSRVKSILADLIAFDTTSHKSNLALIDYICQLLSSYGIKPVLYYDKSGQKANLYASLPAKKKGGIMLSGHTDVVPIDGQSWTFPAFQLTEHDGHYYGRGTTDMKGFIACVLAALPDFLVNDLNIPLHIALSFDEEVGCRGVGGLIDQLKLSDNKPEFCIVGEPTQMQPIYGHKGKVAMRCKVHGRASHSAYTAHGVNAIEYSAQLIHKMVGVSNHLRDKHDNNFDPPFSTMQVGVIQGGNALNIVPQLCMFDFEIRHLPDQLPNEVLDAVYDYANNMLLPQMQAVFDKSHIEFDQLSQYPALLTDRSSPFSQLVAQWAENDHFATVAFGTEAGLFQQAGITTLVCGPGNMAQGHQADEFVAISQLEKCSKMLKNLSQYMTT